MNYTSIFEDYDYFDQLVTDWEQKNGEEFPFTQSEMDGISKCDFQYDFEMQKFEELFEQFDKSSQDKFMFNFLFEKSGIVDFVEEEEFEQDPTHHIICTDKDGEKSYIAECNGSFCYEVEVSALAETMKNTFGLEFDLENDYEELFEEVIEKTSHLTIAGKLHDKLQDDMSKADKLVASISPDAEAPTKKNSTKLKL